MSSTPTTKIKARGDVDNGDIIIKGGKRSEDTTGTGSEGGNSSEGGTLQPLPPNPRRPRSK